MANTDALAICNQAFVSLGEAPIDSFEGPTTPQVVASLRYEQVVESLLAGHPWWWNRRVTTLARLAQAPALATGFSAAYQLPAKVFRIVVPFVDSRPVSDWGLAGEHLLIDATATETVDLEFHTAVDERLFSPAFRQALVTTLAAEFCMALTESESRWKMLASQAAMDLSRARHTNASEKPAIRLPTGGLQSRMRR